jgi:hypothetical protein
MENKICIIYPPGGYGTFIEWIINYLCDAKFSTNMPFTKVGNSHGAVGHLNFVERFSDLSIKQYTTCRLHPIRWNYEKNQTLNDIDNFVNPNFDKVIYVDVTDESLAWLCNNVETKVDLNSGTPGTYIDRVIKDASIDERQQVEQALKQYGASDIFNIEPWILRDFYSGLLPSMHLDNLRELTGETKLKYPNWLFIDMIELKKEFISCILKIIEYCEGTLIPERTDKLESIKNEWTKNQKFIDRDTLIDKIINSILNNTEYDWSDSNLTLVDESLIINILRKHNLEVKSFNLNKFPTSVKDILTYIIPIKDDS